MCYHKKFILPLLDDEILLNIHVGKTLSDILLNIKTDSELNGQTCDNISAKNLLFVGFTEYCNIFIMRHYSFTSYCDWLFSLKK